MPSRETVVKTIEVNSDGVEITTREETEKAHKSDIDNKSIAAMTNAVTPASTKAKGKKRKPDANQRTLGSFFAPLKKANTTPQTSRSGASKTPSCKSDISKVNGKDKITTSLAKGEAKALTTNTKLNSTNKNSSREGPTNIPDKDQIMSIVLGTMADDDTLDDSNNQNISCPLPTFYDKSPLPLPSIRKHARHGGIKHPAKLAITPSPIPGNAGSKSKKAATTTTVVAEEPVKRKLLDKLEKSSEDNSIETNKAEHVSNQKSFGKCTKDSCSTTESTEKEEESSSNNATQIEKFEGSLPPVRNNSSIAPPEAPSATQNKSPPSSSADQSNVTNSASAVEDTNCNVIGESKTSQEDKQISKMDSHIEDESKQKNEQKLLKIVRVENKDDTVDMTSDEPREVVPNIVSETSTCNELSTTVDVEASKLENLTIAITTHNDLKGTEASKEEHVDIAKYNTIRSKNQDRKEALLQRCRDGLEEENFQLPNPSELFPEGLAEVVNSEGDLTDAAKESLAVIIQGSQLPLTELCKVSVGLLQEVSQVGGAQITADAVTKTIKLLAERKSLSGNKAITDDAFENTDIDRMWRWEVAMGIDDLIPKEYTSRVKKARNARNKLRVHYKAITKLLASLDEAGKTSKAKRDKILKRIDKEEERVRSLEQQAEEKLLKAKQEAEKNRLKKKKEQKKKEEEVQKLREKEQKQKEKEQAEAAKKKEKEERQAEKERKKKEAAKAREEQKRKKEEELEEKKEKERLEKEQKLKKQKDMMKSFFSSASKSPIRNTDSQQTNATAVPSESTFNSELFRSSINSSNSQAEDPVFENLSERAIVSRTRRTRKVSLTVFVTVMPENSFSMQQPYDEQKEIQVPNKYKYLSFHEDYRPAYHGTWSKPQSSVVTGKNPFAKDSTYLDYDVDSEAEWEEDDEDPGEDCEDEGQDDEEDNGEDEEGDTRVYNYQDGWLTHDDDLGRDDDEIDEETKALRKKKIQGLESCDVNGGKKSNSNSSGLSTVCVIAPAIGGRPLTHDSATEDGSIVREYIEGVGTVEAIKLLNSHVGTICTPSIELCLDAFPPDLVEDAVPGSSDLDVSCAAGGGKAVAGKGKSQSNQEMTQEDLITFIKYVHHCTLPSKDKVIEEMRNTHPNITSSLAQAKRKLDSIALKKRHPRGSGYVWEVKREILEKLGLKDLLSKQLQLPENETVDGAKTKSVDAKKSKGKKPTTTAAKGTETKPQTATKSVQEAQKMPTNSGSRNNKKRENPDSTSMKASAKLFSSFLKSKKQKIGNGSK